MNYIYYIPFFLFIIAAWFYYQRKMKIRHKFYREKREQYIQENTLLTNEQKENLSKGLPWKGMDSGLLSGLFGEPTRKRALDQSASKSIWSYGTLFVYLDGDIVYEWKSR